MRLPPGPLRSRNFRLLLACDVISMAGSSVAIVATPFAVLAIGGSATDVGFVATASTLTLVAFLLLGGVVADRLPRHQVMLAANLLQALTQAASAALVLTGHAEVWELIALSAGRGVGMGFYFPAAAGLLPQTVPADQRAQASAMDRIGRNGAVIGGSALGGLLVSAAGPGWGLAVDPCPPSSAYRAVATLDDGQAGRGRKRDNPPILARRVAHRPGHGPYGAVRRRPAQRTGGRGSGGSAPRTGP